ncbi:MAG: DAK2 domain-containing protein [Peptostreptococcaceae bacterium]|nr:DAK2 domain-containing protein [Peptostreptococcaceae bacterium]
MNKIDGALLREMIISGANKLTNDKPVIDKLNVFPVPDGDTGTNMSLTIASAVTELNKETSDRLTDIGKAVSKGSLMGARGNSGVILSQILRGFAKGIEGKEDLEPKTFAKALKEASNVAYTAVMKPVEGTILTVIRETSAHAVQLTKQNALIEMGDFLHQILEEARRSLNHTPELLKALKEAGVVDSGGKGLLSFLEGAVSAYDGKVVERREADEIDYDEFMANDNHIFEGEIEFGYCTEFMVIDAGIEPSELRAKIESMGDSMVVVGDDNIIKTHIHTNDPGTVLAIAGKYGALDRIKIENMRLQQKALIQEKPKELNRYGMISVVMGKGMESIMKDLMVDHVIEGGQTMNPSTKDFVQAIEEIHAENIFIFPNNSNIIMAAKQASDLVTDKNIIVIETKTFPQAIASLLVFDPEADIEANTSAMNEAKKQIKSGQVTYAVRDTSANGISIKNGDIIGIADSSIVCSEKGVDTAVIKLLEKMVDGDDIITLYYGEDITEKQAENLKERIEEIYSDMDVEIHKGEQPIYYYIISVE